MEFKNLIIVLLFIIGSFIIYSFAGCSVLKEAIEDANNYISDYDEGIKSLDNYQNTTDLALFMSLPEMNLENFASTTSGKGQEIVDDFGNNEKLVLLPAKDTSHTGQVLYASIELKSGLYNKDKLNCILKDVKAVLNEYNDSCDQLMIVFRDAKKYINWYTFIDNVDNSSTAIVCCADYISYIKDAYITYFQLKTMNIITSVIYHWKFMTSTLMKSLQKHNLHQQICKYNINILFLQRL